MILSESLCVDLIFGVLVCTLPALLDFLLAGYQSLWFPSALESQSLTHFRANYGTFGKQWDFKEVKFVKYLKINLTFEIPLFPILSHSLS